MNLVPRFHYLLIRIFLEKKFKESVVPNTLLLPKLKLYNAEHYSTNMFNKLTLFQIAVSY